MGVYSNWITYITNPANLDPQLWQALQALDSVIDDLFQSANSQFSYDVFYSGAVTSVGQALIEVGNALAASGGSGSPVGSSGFGNRPVVTHYKSGMPGDYVTFCTFPVALATTLGMLSVSCETLGVADVTLNVVVNGAVKDSITIPVGSTGPVSKDISHITLAAGDKLAIALATEDFDITGLCVVVQI